MVSGEAFLYLALIAAAVSIGLITYLLLSARVSEEVLASAVERQAAAESVIMRLILPIARVLAPLHKNALSRPRGQALEKKLIRAGRPFGASVPEFLSMRYVSAMVGAGFGYAL